MGRPLLSAGRIPVQVKAEPRQIGGLESVPNGESIDVAGSLVKQHGDGLPLGRTGRSEVLRARPPSPRAALVTVTVSATDL